MEYHPAVCWDGVDVVTKGGGSMSTPENMRALLKASEEEAMIYSEAGDFRISRTGEREVAYKFKRGISEFHISLLPGCKNVAIFHGVTVDPTHRNEGLGKRLHAYRLRVAQRIGCTTVMCTVLAGNSVEKRILENFGWRKTISVTPGIELWTLEL